MAKFFKKKTDAVPPGNSSAEVVSTSSVIPHEMRCPGIFVTMKDRLSCIYDREATSSSNGLCVRQLSC
jgi:hypothetical protein